MKLASDGLVPHWDKAQLQRGMQVYKEVCSACHSLKFVAFRNLRELGYSEAEVDAEAATWTVPGIDPNTGEVLESLRLPDGIGVSGLESDGGERFFCGGGSSGRLRVVQRATLLPTKPSRAAARRPATSGRRRTGPRASGLSARRAGHCRTV